MSRSCSRPALRGLAALAGLLCVASACSGTAADAGADPVTVSQALEVVGVVDRGLDPSVVAVTNAWGGHCSGVLLASDVVLTARQCVVVDPEPALCSQPGSSPTLAPETADPATLHIYTQVPGAGVTWASAGVGVLTSDAPAICGADVALIILAWPIDGAVASLVSESGIAVGAYVRTVGLGWAATTDDETELLREHLPVLDVSASELAVGEATCVGEPGGIAFDETTGEVVGVLSRWGSRCGAPDQFDVFTRTDAFYGLVLDALAWEPALASIGLDGGAGRATDGGRKRDAGRAKKPLTDIGSTCSSATDCGTGLCVTAEGGEYCSRSCTPVDTCPTDFKCVISAGGALVCVES